MNACWTAVMLVIALVATLAPPAGPDTREPPGETQTSIAALEGVPSSACRAVKRSDGTRRHARRSLERDVATPPSPLALPVPPRTFVVVEIALAMSHAPLQRRHLPESRAPPTATA